jgi:hypothetical protein
MTRRCCLRACSCSLFCFAEEDKNLLFFDDDLRCRTEFQFAHEHWGDVDDESENEDQQAGDWIFTHFARLRGVPQFQDLLQQRGALQQIQQFLEDDDEMEFEFDDDEDEDIDETEDEIDVDVDVDDTHPTGNNHNESEDEDSEDTGNEEHDDQHGNDQYGAMTLGTAMGKGMC